MANNRLSLSAINELLENTSFSKLEEAQQLNIVKSLERNAKTKVSNINKAINKQGLKGVDLDTPALDNFNKRGGFQDYNSLNAREKRKYVASLLQFTDDELVTNKATKLVKYNLDLQKRLNTQIGSHNIDYLKWDKNKRAEAWDVIDEIKHLYPTLFGEGGSYLDSNRVIQTIMIMQQEGQDITSFERNIETLSNEPQALINLIKNKLIELEVENYNVNKWNQPKTIDENEFQ